MKGTMLEVTYTGIRHPRSGRIVKKSTAQRGTIVFVRNDDVVTRNAKIVVVLEKGLSVAVAMDGTYATIHEF